MKISRNWIADYVDFSELSNEEFEDLITTRVAEVDDVFTSASPLSFAVVGKIISATKHPERDKLSIVEVDIGKEKKKLICGAPNCREGILVAYIPVAGEIISPKDDRTIKVEARKVAGVMSEGVLASEAELGISPEHEGIFELEEKAAKAGEKLSKYLGQSDTILEIDNKSLTHRPDLWSHFGFAREIAAILNKPLIKNPDLWADCTAEGKKLLAKLAKGKSDLKVIVEKDSNCRRFAALEFANVSASQSPLWLRRRLYSVGAGVRNLLVDLSNYVMQDIGQPNHAYDAAKLNGKTLHVRRARSSEVFKALDGEDYKLSDQDIAIADGKGVVALGGIMGGEASSVTETTKSLILESANFDPTAIRLSTKKHALRTDASNRFEKSQSAYSVPLAIQRFAELITEIDKDVEIVGSVSEDFLEVPADLKIEVDFSYIRERLGAEISDKRISEILSSLGFVISSKGGTLPLGVPSDSNAKKFEVSVPYFRATRDISIVDDLVEEIGRIHGYENIPEAIPLIQSMATPEVPLKKLIYNIKDSLSAIGFAECDSYSFMDQEYAKTLGYNETAIELENAIDTNAKHLRTTLVPAMLKSIQTNIRHSENFALFEIARSYHKNKAKTHESLKLKKVYPNQACYERQVLCLSYLSGRKENELSSFTSPNLAEGADFFSLLSVIKKIVKISNKGELVIKPITEESPEFRSWMHPYRAASLVASGVEIGQIAELVPGLVEDLEARIVVSEIDLDLLLEIAESSRHFSSIAKFPGSFFEMSVVMPEREHFSRLRELLESKVERTLLREIEVVSVYKGKPLDRGLKSVSVRLSLRADDRTLSGEELQSIQTSLMNAVNNGVYALRT